jgi:hypothetical protein
MSVFVKSFVVALFTLSAVESVEAQSNLIVNPNFDQNVTGWTPENPGQSTFVWNGSQNAPGAAQAGGGAGVLTSPLTNGNWIVDSVCASATFDSGSHWDFGGWMRIPSAQTGSGTAGIGVTFYSTADCSEGAGAMVHGDFISADPYFDIWLFYTKSEILPFTAHSASIYLNIDNSTNLSFGTYFDGLELTDTIFQNGFDPD